MKTNGGRRLADFRFFESVQISNGGNIIPLRRINAPPGITPADAHRMSSNSAIPFCYTGGILPHVDEIARMLLYMGHVPLAKSQHLLYGYYAHAHLLNACAIMMMHMKFPVQASRKEDNLHGMNNAHENGSKAQRRLSYVQEVRNALLSRSQDAATVSSSTRPAKKLRKQSKSSCSNMGCAGDGTIRFGAFCICAACADRITKPIKTAQHLKYDKMMLGSNNIRAGAEHSTCAFRDTMNTSSSELRAYMLGGCMMKVSREQREMVGSMISTNPALMFAMKNVRRLTRVQLSAIAKPNICVANALVDAKTTKETLIRRLKNKPMPFAEARMHVIAANIPGNTRESYDAWAQSGRRVPQIPMRPHLCYGSKWCGWPHFMHADADKDPNAIGREEAAFNSYSSIMFNDAAASGLIVAVADSGAVCANISLSTTANIFSQYVYSDTAIVPGVYAVWPQPKAVFLLAMYKHRRYIICPRMATVTRALRDGLLVIRFVLDASAAPVDEHDPRYLPWRRSPELGTTSRPIPIKYAQYITWGYLFEVLRLYHHTLATGPVHVLLRGDPFAGVCMVQMLRTGSCWRTLLSHDRHFNGGAGISVAGRRCGTVQDRDKITMWLSDPLPPADHTNCNMLSTEMFLSGAFPAPVVPKCSTGLERKRSLSQGENVPKRARPGGTGSV